MIDASIRRPRTRHDVATALALGVTAAGVVRGGGFFTPDLVAVPFVLAAAAIVDGTRITRRDLRVVAALAAFAIVWLLRGDAAGTVARSASLAAAAIAFAGSYVTARRCRSARDRLLVIRALLIISSLVAVVSLLRWAGNEPPWGLPFDGVWRLSGPFAYPNAAGLFFALAFLANVAVDERDWIERTLCGVALIAALVATASRGSFVALGLGLIVLRKDLFTATTRAARIFGVGAVTAAAGAALYVSLLTFGFIGNAGAHSATASMDDRVAEWSAAARQGGAHPVAGSGPERDLYIHNFRGDAIARYAHDEPLQVFAGAGLIGLASLALVVVAMAGALRDEDGPRGRLPKAALAVLIVGGLLDFNWHFVGLVAFAGWLVGLDDPVSTE